MRRAGAMLLAVVAWVGGTGSAAPPARGKPADPGLERGIAHFEAGRDEQAESFFRARLEAEPADARSAYYLGRIFFDREQPGTAIEWLERATDREPRNSDFHLWLGRAYLQKLQKASKRGVASLRRYIEREPGRDLPSLDWAHYRLGLVYEHQGRVEEARSSFETALSIEPDRDDVRKAMKRLR